MKRTFRTCVVLLCCWYISVGQPNQDIRAAQRIYKQALAYFYAAEQTAKTDSLALAGFKRIISLLKPDINTANILINSYLNAGILNQTYSKQAEALNYYNQAIAVGKKISGPDSVLFKPYVYAGTAHYYLHSFDSSTYYWKKAEQVYMRYPQVSEAQRLFNSFGVVYYEAGNYRQSINYFQKALQLNQRQTKLKSDFEIRYTSNIASALRRLGQYESAAELYRRLLPLNINRTELLINLGATYVLKKEPRKALHYLNQVTQPEDEYSILYPNTLAEAYIQTGQYELADQNLRKAIDTYKRQQATAGYTTKNSKIGLTYKLMGDVAAAQGRLRQAVDNYQLAVIQLDFDFNDTNVEHNPSQFTGGFNGFLLFDCLAAKASLLEKEAAKTKSHRMVRNAIASYQSALRLANYIEKSFDSEESRLFASNKVFPVQQQAISLLMQTYEETTDYCYLEEAFRQAEQSKAAVLYIGQKENENKTNTGIPDSLLQRERNLKFTLSQLFMKLDRADTHEEINQYRNNIRDSELALSRLADRLHDYPDYYRKKFGADSISIDFLQREVLKSKTALLSFFQTKDKTYIFVLTPEKLTYAKADNDTIFNEQLSRLLTGLRTVVPGENYQVAQQAQYVYKQLITPVEKTIRNCNSLIIIPHAKLTQLPFEVLEDSRQQFLLQQFDITYQYSASFIRPEAHPIPKEEEKVLLIAPFSKLSSKGPFDELPASEQEVNGLSGTKLINREATKSQFLQLAQNATVIHLATHAVANDQDPSRSFIAFAPQADSNDRLYAHEIQYGLLSQAQLVFLSACETGSGQLIDGEGVMSLSRALSYGGCPNLVTSLWKAEDRATAFISTQFYKHIQDGNSVARALQLAKLDLLNDGRYAQFHSPQYWSHLVFVGSPVEEQRADGLAWWTSLGAGCLLLTVGFWYYAKQKKVTVISQ